jgi:hypothetical protein
VYFIIIAGEKEKKSCPCPPPHDWRKKIVNNFVVVVILTTFFSRLWIHDASRRRRHLWLRFMVTVGRVFFLSFVFFAPEGRWALFPRNQIVCHVVELLLRRSKLVLLARCYISHLAPPPPPISPPFHSKRHDRRSVSLLKMLGIFCCGCHLQIIIICLFNSRPPPPYTYYIYILHIISNWKTNKTDIRTCRTHNNMFTNMGWGGEE